MDRTLGERMWMRPGRADDPETSAAQRWVDAHNHPLIRRREQAWSESRSGGASTAADAVFHLFELPWRDTHRGSVPKQRPEVEKRSRSRAIVLSCCLRRHACPLTQAWRKLKTQIRNSRKTPKTGRTVQILSQ